MLPRDYRIDQLYIHAITLGHKLVYSKDNDSIIVAAYDPSESKGGYDWLTGSSLWIRFQ